MNKTNEESFNEEQNYYKERKKVIPTILFILIDIAIIALVAFFLVGYLNFVKIKDKQDPIFVIEKRTYKPNENTTMTIFDNKIYKIVKQENEGQNIIYSLKLWFMEEVE